MKKLTLIILLIVSTVKLFSQDSDIEKTPLSIGDKVEFYSNTLEEDRVLNVYLPHGYSSDSLKTYPVIYLLDGSIDEDFIHIVGLVQFGSFSWINFIPESIVVGIGNVDRKRDFTYPNNSEEQKPSFPTSGKSADFIQFIQKELKPFIETNYRVTEEETLIGQSLGGLLATEILFKYPETFDNYLIISPSLWWDDKSIFDESPKSFTTKKSVYIGVGKEGYGMEELAEELYDFLLDKNVEQTDLHFEYFEEKDHGDVLHMAVYSAFEKIFKVDEVEK